MNSFEIPDVLLGSLCHNTRFLFEISFSNEDVVSTFLFFFIGVSLISGV